MQQRPKRRRAGALVAAVLVVMPAIAKAQDLRNEIEAIVKDYLASHPDEVAGIVKDYMVQHPELMAQILAEMLKRRTSAGAASANGDSTGNATVARTAQRSAAIIANTEALFSSPHQVTIGNPDSDVTLVEFFDYSCGYCKRALPDLMTLIREDLKVKIVLKDFPILGPGSLEAARVAVAVRMQDDPSGQKYLAFHQALLGAPGPATRDKALAAAREQGLDMARLESDMASEEVAATINENIKLASAVGATGTPTYIIGKDLVVGAVGVASLREHIGSARGRPAN